MIEAQSTNFSDLSDEALASLITGACTERDRRRKTALPVLHEIVARKRSLNGKGNGEQEHRRILLPNGTRGWAVDLLESVAGSWQSMGPLAAARRCSQVGLAPVGTIVVAYETEVSNYSTRSTQVRAGVVCDDAESPIPAWDLPTRGRGDDVEVQHPETGEWVRV